MSLRSGYHRLNQWAEENPLQGSLLIGAEVAVLLLVGWIFFNDNTLVGSLTWAVGSGIVTAVLHYLIARW